MCLSSFIHFAVWPNVYALELRILISACILPLCMLCSAGVLRRPLGLAFDATAGLLYIAEWGAHGIAVMDPATDTVLRTICSLYPNAITIIRKASLRRGKVGELNGPQAIALDGCGNLLVVDHFNNRVVVFDSDTHSGTPIASFPTLPKPYSLFVDASGKVVVGGENFICMWSPFKAHSLNSEKGSYIGSMWQLFWGVWR